MKSSNFNYSGEERQNKGREVQGSIRDLLEKLGYSTVKYSQEGMDLTTKFNSKNLKPLYSIPSKSLVLVSSEERISPAIVQKDIKEIKNKLKKNKGLKPVLLYPCASYKNDNEGGVSICDSRKCRFYNEKHLFILSIIKRKNKYKEVWETTVDNETTAILTSVKPHKKKYSCEVAILVEKQKVLGDDVIKKLLTKVIQEYDLPALKELPLEIIIKIYCLRMFSPDLKQRIDGILSGLSTNQVKLKKPPENTVLIPCENETWMNKL